jgi:hypothetical protein
MRPSFARFNATNGILTNAIFSRYFSLKSRIYFDGSHLSFCQFGGGASFSAIGSSMLDTIKLVAARSIPAQILKAVVKWVAIVMARFHALRARTNKSLQNGFVWINDAKFVVIPKANNRAPFALVIGKLFDMSSLNASNATSIRHFVCRFVSNYRLPRFHFASHLSLMGILE